MSKVSISHKGLTCIYAVLSPTGKIYIGQTWDLYHRYKSGVSKSQRLLYRSYQKHGEEAHKLFTIIEFKGSFTQSDLDHWERYYIEVYKTNGYELLNIREGGGNNGKLSAETKKLIGIKSRKWKQDNPELVKQIASKAAAANIGKKRTEETKLLQRSALIGKAKTKEHGLAISIAKKGKPSSHKGKHFSPEATERIRAAAKTRNQKRCVINQYTLAGEFIKEWPSIKEAAQDLNLHIGTIGGCVRKEKHYKTCGGFIWRYKSDLTPIVPSEHVQAYNPKECPVIQMDLQENIIATFKSVKEASDATGTNRTNLIKCCKGQRLKAGGFIWKYK